MPFRRDPPAPRSSSDVSSVEADSVASRRDVTELIDATRQEVARADVKAAALLTIIGIGFAAFSAAIVGAVAAPVQGAAMWLALVALAGVNVAGELLLLVFRPRLRQDAGSQRYFGYWHRYITCPDVLAADLGANVEQARLLVQLSDIAWRKYLLTRIAVDVLMVVLPLISSAVAVTLLSH